MPLMSEVKKTGKRGEKVGTFLSWTLAVLACLWVAWCCAIGPLYWFGGGLTRCTDCWWKLMLVFVIGWLWVPTTLLAAFGADIRSQIREFSWALNQWMGLKQPYIGFFSFVPMDIYPTAHYMWPDNPTYLTDQHNVVLTVLYGAVAAVSRYFTDSNDAGIVVLAALQWLFAAFCGPVRKPDS